MANLIQIQGGVSISTEIGSVPLFRAFNITQVGTNHINQKQSIGTVAEALSTLDLANLRYCGLYNPADSGGTITVTTAPIVIIPGDVMIFPPASLNVTMQANVAATKIFCAGVEA